MYATLNIKIKRRDILIYNGNTVFFMKSITLQNPNTVELLQWCSRDA